MKIKMLAALFVLGIFSIPMFAQEATQTVAPTPTPEQQQVPQRYTPQFVKYVETRIIRVDHFILDDEGNLTKWCAIAIEDKETGELTHCINK